MTTLIHAPTIHAIRCELATLRVELLASSPATRVVEGAATIADDVIGLIDTRLAEMMPACACAPKTSEAQ